MSAARRLRLPRFSVILALTTVALLVPLLWNARAEVADASARVEGAKEAEATADRLDTLLRLAPLLSAERTQTGALLGTVLLPDGVPTVAVSAMGLDFEAQLEEARTEVDPLVARLDDLTVADSLTAVREYVDSGDGVVFTADDDYDGLLARVEEMVDRELSALYSSGVTAGAGADLIATARVAEAAAGVQIEQAAQGAMWAGIFAPFAAPTVVDVRELGDSLARLEQRTEEMDALVDDLTATGALWTDPERVALASAHREYFSQIVADLTAQGVPAGPRSFDVADFADFDFSEIDFTFIMGVVDEMSTRLAIDTEVVEGVGAVVDAALDDVQREAAALRADAVSARNGVILWIAIVAVLLVVGGLLLTGLVVRPVARLQRAAASMRDGDLDVRVPEKGPTEVRVAANAMNEAIDSLKLAESQAVALAEERLGDPILQSSVPGTLGTSLQAAVGHLTATLTEREEFQRRLAHEAAHDGLTRLPNRNAIMSHIGASIARTRRSSTSMALLFIDLDGFKSVNDQHGHHVGDRVLQATAQRLAGAIREGDIAGRLGGDEFVVVAESIDGIDDALGLGERIIEKLVAPLHTDGAMVDPTVSIGVAITDGWELTADELLRDADLAVYRAKDLGRGRIEVCDEDLRGEVVERANLESAIVAGLERDEFLLHFQPTVDSQSREVVSLEALVRWERPDVGLVPPGDFIPVAERSDLIMEIDRWVLLEATRQMAEWSNDPVMGSLPVSVNISGRHLSGGSLVNDVTSALKTHGVSGEQLIVEVTETALMDDLAAAARELGRLRERGVRVALDDFGTGYMSLATLRNLPVDVLKIDRSFVAQMESARDHTLVELIVNTGHLLGVTVTAEGVETPQQADLLNRLGSDHLQGFLFSRPLDAPTLVRRLDAATAPTG